VVVQGVRMHVCCSAMTHLFQRNKLLDFITEDEVDTANDT